MDRDLLIAAIQTRIDDVNVDAAIDVVSNPLLTSILDQQLANCFKVLPIRLLPYKEFTSSISTEQTGLCSVELPDDFLRLVRFKTTPLLRPIMEADLVSEGSRDHIFMYQSYVSGGNAKVRGCLVKGVKKKLIYNASEAGSREESLYVSTPTHLDVADEILDPVAWYVASVAFQILGEQPSSQAALAKVNEFLNSK